jgi:hypothetical protein
MRYKIFSTASGAPYVHCDDIITAVDALQSLIKRHGDGTFAIKDNNTGVVL